MSKKNKGDKAAKAEKVTKVKAPKDNLAAEADKRGKDHNQAEAKRKGPAEAENSEPASAKQDRKSARANAPEDKGGLNEREITLISKALADPKRMAIFRRIAQGDTMCGDIKNCIAVSAATLSHHMKELETAGLIETSREGRFMRAALKKKVWKNYLGELKDFAG